MKSNSDANAASNTNKTCFTVTHFDHGNDNILEKDGHEVVMSGATDQ